MFAVFAVYTHEDDREPYVRGQASEEHRNFNSLEDAKEAAKVLLDEKRGEADLQVYILDIKKFKIAAVGYSPRPSVVWRNFK